jgi:uncharacterized membrane protein
MMKRKSILKILHILSACMWFGTATSVVLLQCAGGWSDNNQELAALNHNFTLLDLALIIPGAMGSFLTGFLICKTTSWGFTRYWWVIAKGIGTVCGILIGTALLGPWQMQMVKLSAQMANALDTGSPYSMIRSMFTLVSFVQVLLLIFNIILSVRKPWGKRLSKQDESREVEQRTLSTSI